MSNDYLNGIETQREKTGTPAIQGVDTAIIGLVGTAPIFDVSAENQKVNEIVQATRSNWTKFFGNNRSNYTIPAALDIIFKLSNPKVFVINVFDPAKHKASVSSSLQFKNGSITLNECGITKLTVTKEETPAVLDTDYTFDGTTIKIKSGGSLSADDNVTVAYDYADPSKVTTADIIGAVDEDGNKTGIKKLLDCKSVYGYKAKILIAPVFSATKAVDTELQTIVKRLKAFTYIDPPKGTSIDAAIKGRNENGEINFNINDIRAELACPWLKYYNSFEDKYEYYPPSAFMAGLRAEIDRTKGVHWSISNQQLTGVEGLEFPIYFELEDPSSDTNLLNAQGITTFRNDKGVIYTWGNRNSSFPTNTDIDSFSCVARTADYIEESVQESSVQFMAGPISGAVKDRILTMAKNWFKKLKTDGVIVDGKVWYDEELNPASQLAAGKLILTYEFLSPAPLEHLTYKSQINIDLYNLGGTN